MGFCWGVCIIDKGYNIQDLTSKYELPRFGINTLAEDQEGNIIFGGSMGLYITNGKNIKQYRYGDGIGSGIITDVFIDEKIITGLVPSGLVLFDGQTFQNWK